VLVDLQSITPVVKAIQAPARTTTRVIKRQREKYYRNYGKEVFTAVLQNSWRQR